MCNATLQVYGGDLYVGVMTVISSIREIATLPVTGVTHSAQPVLGFNYGAKEYGRVKRRSSLPLLLQFYIRPVSADRRWFPGILYPHFLIRMPNSSQQVFRRSAYTFRILYDVAPILRTVDFRRSGQIKKRSFLYFPKSNHRRSADNPAARYVRNGHQRRIRRRTDFQLCRRNCLLWNDAFDDLERIDEIAEREGFLKIERLFI